MLRPISGNKQFNGSFIPQAIKLWNNATPKFRQAHNIYTAKKEATVIARMYPI